ncbi:MAG: hypothetical protein PGN15_07540 [Aeromicrobium erythreum]
MSERRDAGRGDIDAYASVAALFDAMSTPLRAALVHRLCAGSRRSETSSSGPGGRSRSCRST